MVDMPQVVLLLSHHAGYDRGVLQGIVRYSRVHGPWNLYLAGVEPGLPLPEMETFSNGPIQAVDVRKSHSPVRLPDLRQWETKGIIGRLQNRRIAKWALGVGVPVIAMDLSEEQLAGDLSVKKLSEIRSDSLHAGRMAAEHLLDRGFRTFGYCGYSGRTWSERSREGFCKCVKKAGFPCNVYQPSKHNRPILWQQERSQVSDWLRSL